MKHRDRGESVYEAERVYGPQYQSATYESILEIDNVRTEHYTTTFRCEAVNKFGAASNDMQVRNCNDVLNMINYRQYFVGSLVEFLYPAMTTRTENKFFLLRMKMDGPRGLVPRACFKIYHVI